MAIAEIFLTAFITVLFDQLASADLIKLAQSRGINSQLNKWKKTLTQILAVLADAGQKQIKERCVDLWLHDLQDLAYEIDDLLDDLATESLHRKLNRESHVSTDTNKVLKLIPTCCTNFTPRNIMYGRKMSSKLDEITIKLHNLAEQRNTLGLNANVNVERSNRRNRRLEETSLVDESKVLGREGDKEALLGKLLGNEACNQNVNILSIVGLGGIGKTTLAKVLYNEEKVKDHFELRAWVCVSEELDVFNISKAIFQAVGGTNQEFANLDLLHVALKEKLWKKRFLVVLDDVWNEDYREWELLQSPFAVGAPGSKIIVTTRKTKVATVMNSFQPYNLKVLSNEKALSLFAQYALDEQNFDKHPTLKWHGESIVNKCGRLPLALITLGRMLRTKTDDSKWEEVLNSEIWNLEDGNQILPALRLSYHDLPPHLKHLFAYCSVFPKDYVFDKKELVLLWMAEGFLYQSDVSKSMESLGHEYFEELKSRSFFQPSTNDQSQHIMHDLINDLATNVAGEFFFRLHDNDIYCRSESLEKCRHISLIGQAYGTFRMFKELQRARRLRTFLPVPLNLWQSFHLSDDVLVELLPQLQFLRVLSLCNHSITSVPQSIGNLKHIRYLNFSKTGIKRLPEQIGDLYNLQSLLLCGCHDLSSLSISFVKLINMRHLDISDTPKLKKMPLGIGGLTSLQTLPKVIIEGANGFRISELKGLSELQGRLSIMGLEKVINPIQAKDANLQQKKGLVDLKMIWSDSLRKLSVSRMDKVKNLGSELLAPTNSYNAIAFPSLQILEFFDMESWESWSSSIDGKDGTFRSFPCLRDISMGNCPKLVEVSIDSLPLLRVLHIGGCFEVVLRSMVGVSSSIEMLTMDNIKGLTQLHGEVLKDLGAVEDICIRDCDELRYLWESESEASKFLGRLRNLEVSDCKNLVSLGDKEVNLGISMKCIREVELLGSKTLENYNCSNSTERLEISKSPMFSSTLKFLFIQNCDNLRLFPQGWFVHLTTLKIWNCDTIETIPDKGFGFLPLFCLKCLWISSCKNLKSFPHEHLQRLTSLEELWINDCPSMDYSFPCGLWPPNLRSLRIGCLNKCMSEWGLQNYPTSLVELDLYGKNSRVVSFAEIEDVRNSDNTTSSSSFLLPRSLNSLFIRGFEDLESISEALQHLPYLKQLHIWSCPKLRDLSERTSVGPSSLTLTVYQ
ncbi:Disease resistance protein [Cynara cardunculus var. scolymus]|uniref:Disease resistance protein n=1 Tax=Cynara cardunculus var. scolymus TaxID=59895 RepID=A0A103Y160_CYNCS|nr:Disease resistance protein [Cynara cardunculus var. scolymus]